MQIDSVDFHSCGVYDDSDVNISVKGLMKRWQLLDGKTIVCNLECVSAHFLYIITKTNSNKVTSSYPIKMVIHKQEVTSLLLPVW